MDNAKLINGLSRIESLIPTKPKDIAKVSEEGVSFKDTLHETLRPELDKKPIDGASTLVKDASAIKFSNHAIERMQTRGITYNPESLAKLNEAVQKAAAKGSKDTLVLMDNSALIVSVKNNTVVTVMDKNALKENVFTNIDSTVVL